MRRYTQPGVVRPAGDDLLSAAPSRGSTRIGPLSASVRVPALVVSPYTEATHVPQTLRDGKPEKMVSDHTSIIKTILLRFCCGELSRAGLPAGHP
jgi:hypothetical protein